MRTSESTIKLTEALVAARPAFKPLLRAALGQVGQDRHYRYADLSSLLDAVDAALTAHGLTVVQPIDTETATLITRLAHVSGEWIESTYPLKLDLSPQQFGSLLTYGRRYSLQSLLCLAAEDDDAAGAQPTPPKARAKNQVDNVNLKGGNQRATPPAKPPAADVQPAGQTTPRRAGPAPSQEKYTHADTLPRDGPAPAPVQAPAASTPYVTSDVAVALVEDRPAKDGSTLHWVRDTDDQPYYTRDGILSQRLQQLAGTGQVVRLTWQSELIGDRIVRQLRGVSPATDDAPF